MSESLSDLTLALRELADGEDRDPQWPARGIAAAAERGAMRWCISPAYGGIGVDSAALLERYEALGRGSLSIALILTQRDGACQLLEAGENEELKNRLLPSFAAGDAMVTVGISQLTTSTGSGSMPHMSARAACDGYTLHGRMPWVTAAGQCDQIVTGAVLEDGRQLLASVPVTAEGLCVGPPLALLALESSMTARVECDGVLVTEAMLLRPVQHEVLRQRAPTKSLTVAAVGIGFAASLLDEIRTLQPPGDGEFDGMISLLDETYSGLRTRVMDCAAKLDDATFEVPKSEIRAAVNDLINRAAVVCMTLAKGTGYLSSHRAQKLLREAMFFNVWSAPTDVRKLTLTRLLAHP
ncbi:MAG: acyl-CoA dehydrogenase family protein [Phycisphaerae bacterium]